MLGPRKSRGAGSKATVHRARMWLECRGEHVADDVGMAHTRGLLHIWRPLGRRPRC